MTTKTNTKQAARASTTDLQALAAQGVQRALAVRMTELSAQQVQAVSGAAGLMAFDDYCGTGVRPIPKFTGATGVGGGVIVIINGQYGNLNKAALGGAVLR